MTNEAIMHESLENDSSPTTNSSSITITRKVKKLDQNRKFSGKKDFFDKCKVDPTYQVEAEQITIQASKVPPPEVKVADLNIPEYLLKLYSGEEITHIANQLIHFASDPFKVASHLKDLDEDLGKEMEKNQVVSHQDILSDYLIAGRGNFIPGAPPPSYIPLKKGRLLDSILLKKEGLRDVNKYGYVVKFIGFISSMIADRVVASGQLFNENKQVNRVLLHGSYTHRLLLEAFAHAIDKGDINLKVQTGKLNFLQLLEMLVSVKTKSGLSIWETVLDTVEDSERASIAPCDSKQFSFSCRSPFILNSLLLCFGKELGLPNLQTYLLDSHYKAAYEMVLRSRKEISKSERLSHHSQLNIPNEQIYERCMEHFSTMAESYGEVGGLTPFTVDELDILTNPRYVSSIWGPSIRIKMASQQKTGSYADWMDFFQTKGGGVATNPMPSGREANRSFENTNLSQSPKESPTDTKSKIFKRSEHPEADVFDKTEENPFPKKRHQ